MRSLLTVSAAEITADLRADGWRTADVLGDGAGHRTHQLADICEPGNIQTVARALLLAWCEALALARRLDCIDNTEAAAGPDNRLRLPKRFICSVVCAPERLSLLARTVHEYMVARAWLAFMATLPETDIQAAGRRVSSARSAMTAAVALAVPDDPADATCGAGAFRRRLPPW